MRGGPSFINVEQAHKRRSLYVRGDSWSVTHEGSVSFPADAGMAHCSLVLLCRYSHIPCMCGVGKVSWLGARVIVSEPLGSTTLVIGNQAKGAEIRGVTSVGNESMKP